MLLTLCSSNNLEDDIKQITLFGKVIVMEK